MSQAMNQPASTSLDPRSIRVAAIVVNYNCSPLLDRCLAAIDGQTRKPERIIVIDNASSDQSFKKITNRYPDVEVVVNRDNLGFAQANNQAADLATDVDWLALINPDAEPAPDWLEQLIQATERYPQAASLASLTLNAADPTTIDGAGDDYHVSGLVWRRGYRTKLQQQPVEREVFSACAAAALYRRSAWQQAGGFDPDYFCYQEDVDLGFRLRLAGHRNYFIPTARALHIGSAVTGLDSEFALYHGHRNLVWTFFKNMPMPLLLALLPLHILAQVYLLIRHARVGKASSLVQAFADAWQELPAQLNKRRRIHAERKLGSFALLRLLRWSRGKGL
jgi:GT2 family glycosyltransferase